MSQQARMINMASVKAIMQQRIAVPETMVGGKKILFTVQGNGTEMYVQDKGGNYVNSAADPEEVLKKKIFNVKANSTLAMGLKINRDLLAAGVAAEKAGDMDEAHEHFSKYLNAVQISFNILLPNKLEAKLSDGVEIAARVQKITTDNGSLLTLDPATITVVEPEYLGKTTFSFDEFMPTEEETTSEEATPATDAVKALQA